MNGATFVGIVSRYGWIFHRLDLCWLTRLLVILNAIYGSATHKLLVKAEGINEVVCVQLFELDISVTI